MRSLCFAICLLLFASTVHAQSVTRAITWDPSPEETRVLEYHVFRDGVFAGPITVPARTFTFGIVAGQATTFIVYSYGWKLNADGSLSSEAGVGAPSVPFTWTEPTPPPPPTVSADGATTPPEPWLVDTAGGRWRIDAARLILLNDVQAGNGVGDLILWFGGTVYVKNAVYPDANGSWWQWLGSGWTRAEGDPRAPAPPPPPPPPPPPSSGCLTGGTLAPIGSILTQTMKNGDVDPFIAARTAEGWALTSRKKAKNLTTVTMTCQG
jgi:hypothetical protein